MLRRPLKVGVLLVNAALVFGLAATTWCQDTAPLPPQPAPAAGPADAAPEAPKGVEVLTRGPVHEAFAGLAADPAPTKPVAKQPPKPLDEMPPAEKPEGDVLWINGYWAWDDDRNDFLWVSGVWRTPPPNKQWVPGYWRDGDGGWQWVAGFWCEPPKEKAEQEVAYLPAPPAPPQVTPPPAPPSPDTFYVPGHYVWNGTRYDWQAGYWGKVQPNYVWVAAHYRWTPGGYVFIPGYWDLAVSKRGVLYAPVYVDPAVVTVSFTYTPAYAVNDTLVVDTLWVRPAQAHYYFGDYYGPAYRDMGFESCVVYSRGHYDSIIVYERYEHRREPDWFEARVVVYNERYDHPERRPPRTLVQQNIVINQKVTNNYILVAPPAQVAAAKGIKTVPVDTQSRLQALHQAAAVQQVAAQRTRTEVAPKGTPPQPRVASLTVPKAQPVGARPASSGTGTSGVVQSSHTGDPAAKVTAPPHGSGTGAPPGGVQTSRPGDPGNKAAAPPAQGTGAVAPPAKNTGTLPPPAAQRPAPPPPPGAGNAVVPPHGTPPPKNPPPPPAKRPPPKDKDKDEKDRPRS